MIHVNKMIPSKFDARDELHPHPLLALAPQILPPSVDLCKFFSPIRDQGVLGTCAFEAYTAFLEFRKPKPVVRQSVLFPYYNVRVGMGTVGEDSGAEPRDVFKNALSQGECANKWWPYYVKKFVVKPSPMAYLHAYIPAITSYHALTSALEVKTLLANGSPVYLGMAVYESFEDAAIATTGIMPMPESGEQLLGYHAVVAGGYNDAIGYFKVRNSWGTKWGKHGYFYMPYAYMMSSNYITDKWAIIV